MLKRVKKWLGIEGVKVELLLPEVIHKKDGEIAGVVRLSSMNAQSVVSLHFKLIEKYVRGRRKSKLTDEYLIAEKEVQVLIEVPAEHFIDYPFTLGYELMQSKMDELERKNIFLRGLVKAAKTIKSVKSEYRIIVEADVLGTALNPFDQKVIELH
jgi:hypothetical protein